MSFFISRVLTRPVYVSALLSDIHVYLQTTINEQLDCKTFHQRAKVYRRSQHEWRVSQKKMIVSSQNSVQYGRELNRASLLNANHNLHTKNTSLCSVSYVCWQRGTTCIRPPQEALLCAVQQSIDISRWPGAQQQTCSSGISAVGQTDGWTDGRTPDRCIDPIPHSMQVVPINVGPLNPIVCQHGNTKGHLTERSVYGTLVRVHVSTCWRLQQTFYTNNFTTKCNENYVSNVCCTQFRIVMVCFTFFPITVPYSACQVKCRQKSRFLWRDTSVWTSWTFKVFLPLFIY